MQDILNKKGLSDIVVTVMLILVGIAAVSLIGFAVLQVARAPSLSPEFSCFDYKAKQVLSIQDVCYDNLKEEVNVKLKRSLDDKLGVEQIDFILDSSEGSSVWKCGCEDCLCDVLGAGGVKSYYFDVSGLAKTEKIILKVGDCGLDEKIMRDC